MIAMYGFKSVAERGDWGYSLSKAQRFYDDGKHAEALTLFVRMAAIGYESAQFNAAYLLSQVSCLPVLVVSSWLSTQPTTPTPWCYHICDDNEYTNPTSFPITSDSV
jgi:hypothetical protein